MPNEWTDECTHTLVNLAAMRSRKNNNDNHKDTGGEPDPLPTAEYGKKKIVIGSGEQWVNQDPEALTNEPESQAITIGYHPESAIKYLTTAEARALAEQWSPEEVI